MATDNDIGSETEVGDAARRAVEAARLAQEALRDVHGGLLDAIDQVGSTVKTDDHRLPAAAVERWVGALTLTAQLTTLVDAIAADSRRRLPAEALPAVVTPLREALARSHRCAEAVRVACRVARLTERRLRRGADDDDPILRSVAARWGVAVHRWDGLAARLEVGGRALEAYLEGLVHGTDHDAVRRARLARLLPAPHQSGTDAALEARRVGRLAALAGPDRPSSRRQRNSITPWLWTRDAR